MRGVEQHTLFSTPFSSLHDSQFQHWESGKIRGGIKHKIRTELGVEDHECYQYGTVEEIIEAAEYMQKVPGMLSVEVVTHGPEYRNMRTVAQWEVQA